MNLYEVVSEEYETFRSIGMLEPPECGRDWCVVAAETRGKARYLAAKLFKYRGQPVDWPALKVEVLARLQGDWIPGAEQAGDGPIISAFYALWPPENREENLPETPESA